MWGWTQGLMNASQMLYHWVISSALFCFCFLLFILRWDSLSCPGLSWTLPVAQVDLKLDCLDSACQVPGITPVPPGLSRSCDNSNMTETVSLRTDFQTSHTGGACPGAGSLPPVCSSPVTVFGFFLFYCASSYPKTAILFCLFPFLFINLLVYLSNFPGSLTHSRKQVMPEQGDKRLLLESDLGLWIKLFGFSYFLF